MKPTHVSLFSGCGGSSLGFKLAGFKTLLAVEWDQNAADTYRANFPDTPLFHGDIAKLSVDEALQRTGLAPGELDCMDMSPPCQGFSQAGKRKFADPRNQLFKEAVRLLKGFQPRTFVCENVRGMVSGQMKLIFRDVMNDFRGAGYKVAARLLSAAYYGVAQNRYRVIIVGVRSDLPAEPSHPTALGRPLTVREAWMNPTDIRFDRGDQVKGPAAIIAPHVPPGGNNGGGKYSLKIRGTTSGFGLSRLAWDKPSPTIPKLSLLSSSPLLHPDSDHRLTIRQAARLASFPDSFAFHGSFADQWGRIGNSVPPAFMAAIAGHVRDNILSRIPRERAA